MTTKTTYAGRRASRKAQRAKYNARPIYRGTSFKEYARSGSSTVRHRPGKLGMAAGGAVGARVAIGAASLGPAGVALALPAGIGASLGVGYVSTRLARSYGFTSHTGQRTAKQQAASRRNIRIAQSRRR